MTSHVALDKSNNLVIENNTFRLVDDGAELVQRLRCRLLSYMGEWFLDVSSGIAYFQEIFTKPVDIANVESLIKEQILDTEGVTSITQFAMEFGAGDKPRGLSILFSVKTIYGSFEGVTINV